ncbi:MAG: translation initiation factor IF-2 [bacterium]|nr:translation initiation factor IF-2 [bacterium]
MSNEAKTQNSVVRPPIVVVVGHIDHGKTTLLDHIRKSNVAAGETGGITQHIGAYEVEHDGKKITFLDTPGHEAFSKMRSRGAKVADIAILVVAADDGVKPQTKEALAAIKANSLPYLVAINKIDKSGADIDRVKSELAKEEVFLEGRGGNVPFVEISAKEGKGINELLETILLMAELESFTADPGKFSSGVVIESHLDKKRGITSTLLVREGTLKKGEYVVAGGAQTKVRILEDFLGKPADYGLPSSPVVIVGFDKLPQVGIEFKAFFSQKEAAEEVRKFKEAIAPGKKSDFPGKSDFEEGAKVVLGVIIKTDVLGSGEAIRHEIDKIKSEKIDIKFLRIEAGEVSADDVKLVSSAKNSIIVAFKTGIAQDAKDLAERMGVEIAPFQIIYEVSAFLKTRMTSILPAEIKRTVLGKAKILKIFKGEKDSQVVGGRVTEGALKKNAKYDVLRRENKIGSGKIGNVQSGRTNVGEVAAPDEFGALCDSSIALAAGDTLEAFLEEETRGEL